MVNGHELKKKLERKHNTLNVEGQCLSGIEVGVSSSILYHLLYRLCFNGFY